MARPPLTAAPAQPTPITPPPTATPTPTPMGMVRPGMTPARAPGREPGERRTLVVGRGISVQGTVQDAERLVVEGTVEATMIHASELSVAPGGMFKGEIEVDDAEIAGTIDGTLTAKGNLTVRATGKVLGTARCARLQVEVGGQITGRIEMISEGAAAPAPGTPAVA
jgi:cytoskeletal protein CcmA (bactofilin family)